MDEVLPSNSLRPWTRSLHLGSDLESGEYGVVSDHVRRAIEAMSKRPWLTALGTIEPRKDYATILDAYEKLWSNGVNVGLVVQGKQGWNVDDLTQRIRRHSEFGGRLLWLETPSDADVRFVLSHTSALIQASVAEGFGLPIVEAGRLGVPLVLSDIPVFREIAGAEATYFPVGDSETLARVVLRHARTGELRRTPPIRTLTWRQSSARLAAILVSTTLPT
jgi:glycosyltransferase involved in cell wall biosynthesis